MRALFILFGLMLLATSVFGEKINLESGHDVAFYTKLRFDYAAQKDYSPDWVISDERKAIVASYKKRGH